MSYTPEKPSSGPWTLQQLDAEHHGYANWPTYAVRSLSNVCLAIVGDVDRYESERIPANARLIAAAPELLEALSGIVNAFEPYIDSETDSDIQARERAWLVQARAAIAKAMKGE